MNENFVRVVCHSIEKAYWDRYLEDYNQYGGNAENTISRWNDYQVANDITQQILNALGRAVDETNYKTLDGLIADVNINEIIGQIKNDRLGKWCDSWRDSALLAYRELAKKYTNTLN